MDQRIGSILFLDIFHKELYNSLLSVPPILLSFLKALCVGPVVMWFGAVNVYLTAKKLIF